MATAPAVRRSSSPLPQPAVLDPVPAGGHVAPGTCPAVGAVVERPLAVRVAACLEPVPGAIVLRVADHQQQGEQARVRAVGGLPGRCTCRRRRSAMPTPRPAPAPPARRRPAAPPVSGPATPLPRLPGLRRRGRGDRRGQRSGVTCHASHGSGGYAMMVATSVSRAGVTDSRHPRRDQGRAGRVLPYPAVLRRGHRGRRPTDPDAAPPRRTLLRCLPHAGKPG